MTSYLAFYILILCSLISGCSSFDERSQINFNEPKFLDQESFRKPGLVIEAHSEDCPPSWLDTILNRKSSEACSRRATTVSIMFSDGSIIQIYQPTEQDFRQDIKPGDHLIVIKENRQLYLKPVNQKF